MTNKKKIEKKVETKNVVKNKPSNTKRREMKEFVVTPEMETFFWSRVIKGKPNECWIWKGSKRSDGKGAYTYSQPIEGTKTRKQMFISAQRVSWAINIGKIPKNKLITQICNSKLCQNPAHLRAFTHRELINKMKKEGNHHVGIKHGKSKLEDNDVLFIRKLWATGLLSLTDIHKLVPKVSTPNLGFICQGDNWTHLPHYKPVKWETSPTPPKSKIHKKNNNRLFTPDQVKEIRDRWQKGEPSTKLAEIFGCSVNTICWIVKGRVYKDVNDVKDVPTPIIES